MAPEWVSPFASFFSSYTLRPRRPKAALKAKWDHCFERLLDNGLDASRQSRAFWDDLLLLDVNAPLLERLFRERTPDDVHAARANIAATCAECLRRLETRDVAVHEDEDLERAPTRTSRRSCADPRRS